MIELAEKVQLLHAALDRAGIPHAFGGALALAYCINEPRATADIDVNVFVPPDRAGDVVAAMPSGVSAAEEHVAMAIERGQVRIPWDVTPIDLFFSYHAFHDEAAARSRLVRFSETKIPVLDCSDLVVFKAIFGRTRDWVDIENVIASGGINRDVAVERLEALLGPGDQAAERLKSITPESGDESEPYRRAFGSPRDTQR